MLHATALPKVTALPLDIERIYRSHRAAVGRWAARLAGPGLEAEDVVQEVFMIAQRKLGSFRGEASPARWLYGITERVVWHRRRGERWRRWLGGSLDRAAAEVPTNRPTPLEALESRQASVLFYRALEGVSENHRAAFILFELEEMSGEQIAALKGVAVSTVWVWLHRARARFLVRWKELEAEVSR
jgi:RNA polymerase sigma-70 factor (ECF subfamily)